MRACGPTRHHEAQRSPQPKGRAACARALLHLLRCPSRAPPRFAAIPLRHPQYRVRPLHEDTGGDRDSLKFVTGRRQDRSLRRSITTFGSSCRSTWSDSTARIGMPACAGLSGIKGLGVRLEAFRAIGGSLCGCEASASLCEVQCGHDRPRGLEASLTPTIFCYRYVVMRKGVPSRTSNSWHRGVILRFRRSRTASCCAVSCEAPLRRYAGTS